MNEADRNWYIDQIAQRDPAGAVVAVSADHKRLRFSEAIRSDECIATDGGTAGQLALKYAMSAASMAGVVQGVQTMVVGRAPESDAATTMDIMNVFNETINYYNEAAVISADLVWSILGRRRRLWRVTQC